jgi:hypothetical protein
MKGFVEAGMAFRSKGVFCERCDIVYWLKECDPYTLLFPDDPRFYLPPKIEPDVSTDIREYIIRGMMG